MSYETFHATYSKGQFYSHSFIIKAHQNGLAMEHG